MERKFRSFYTNSDPITDYMVKSIEIKSGDYILEPSAGEGAFIDKLVEANNNINILAYDINPNAINTLMEKYKDKNNILIKKSDTLLDDYLDNIILDNKGFDKIIGNPPYGSYIEMELRDIYKAKYSMYAKESYTLFLSRCIDLLNDKGILSFIIPDTYLFEIKHNNVRKKYSKLSIITLEKNNEKNAMNNKIKLIKNINTEDDIINITNNKLTENLIVLD